MGRVINIPLLDVLLILVVLGWVLWYANREGKYQRLAREHRRKMGQSGKKGR